MLNESETTVYRKSLSKQVIATATEAFFSKGIKAVKMDDIASQLSISKRTLYELFANKEKLLLECVKEKHNEFRRHMDDFIREDTSVISIIIETYRYQMSRANGICQAYYYDLQRYPNVKEWINEQHNQRQGTAMEFYRQGVEEGFFRSDVDFTLISNVCNASMDYIMKNQLFKHYSMSQIFHNIILLYVRGFCTLKGVKALEEYNL